MVKLNNTKELIFDKALELFANHGYDAVSIRKITKAVGIKESSFYNHFAGKASLMEEIYAIADKDLRSTKLPLKQIEDLTSKISLRQYLKAGIERFLANIDRPEALKVWFVISMEQYRDERAGNIVIDEDERVMEQISYAFEQFQKKGKMKKANPLTLAHLYGFSLRAIHLDYTIRMVFNKNADYSRNKMYEVMELFADEWET